MDTLQTKAETFKTTVIAANTTAENAVNTEHSNWQTNNEASDRAIIDAVITANKTGIEAAIDTIPNSVIPARFKYNVTVSASDYARFEFILGNPLILTDVYSYLNMSSSHIKVVNFAASGSNIVAFVFDIK